MAFVASFRHIRRPDSHSCTSGCTSNETMRDDKEPTAAVTGVARVALNIKENRARFMSAAYQSADENG
jgi:hypothetical protein